MKFFFLPLVLFFTLVVHSCRKEPEKTEPKIETPQDAVFTFKQNLYKNQIDSVFKKYGFNGSIAVFQDSLQLARKDLGFENFNTKISLNPNSVFAIGSVSKQFTAVMLLLLEEQKKLSIEDPVSRYLEEFSGSEKKNITVHQLMNHTSGISDFGDGLMFAPGTSFNYSNKGYYFLGKIIEKISGRSYAENAKALFSKAGMKNSFTADDFKGNHFASAYTGTPKHFHEVEHMPKRLAEKSISNAAGGILSSTDDLNRWNQALHNGKILSSASYSKFIRKDADREHPIFGKMGYALGIMIYPAVPVSYFHSGYIKGSPSLNVYYPETKTSVIILSNIANENLGKNAFFNPHVDMKTESDKIETAAAQIQKTLIQTEQN